MSQALPGPSPYTIAYVPSFPVNTSYYVYGPNSPATPTLTLASSIPCSPGPITPPPMSQVLSRPSAYTIAYLPSESFPVNTNTSYYVYGPNLPSPIAADSSITYAVLIRPHTLLQTAAVTWNLMENPTSITRNNHLLSSRLLCEQATTPPLPFLSITSIHLPWRIKVRASNGIYVTLGDVFDSIYRSLRKNITPSELNLFPHVEDQKRATRAYKERYRRLRSTSARDEEKRGGMKRIDFLMGRTNFHDISNTGRRSDEWRLNVS
ncbi:hypothetical protein BYT27DRAFT_7197902 [Phlegmacium glaucopus]|nr:hypothetical protein BYT27DRAFT_7197902 [Phlegmacium glaucopus]